MTEMIANVDGAAEPTNPGHMSSAYILRNQDGLTIDGNGFYMGQGTNNEAEYIAVGKCIRAAIDLGCTKLTIFSDSQLVVNQITGKWKVKATHLQKYLDRIHELLGQVDEWTINWIPREQNEDADELSKEALRKHGIRITQR